MSRDVNKIKSCLGLCLSLIRKYSFFCKGCQNYTSSIGTVKCVLVYFKRDDTH